MPGLELPDADAAVEGMVISSSLMIRLVEGLLAAAASHWFLSSIQPPPE